MADTASLIARVKTEGVAQAGQQLDGFSAAAGKAEGAANKLPAATEKAAKGVSRVGQVAGQAGYQIQDFIVQIQGGQSALLAFSQQGGQLFGAINPLLGLFVTLGTVAGSVLYNAFSNATASTKDLEEAQKQLKDTFQQTNSGTLELTDGMIQLTQVSAAAAETQLALAKANAEIVAQSTAKSVKEDADSWGTWKASTDAAISQYDSLIAKGRDVGDTLEKLSGTYEGNIVGVNILAQNIAELSDKFGVNRNQALDMIAAQSEFNKQPTAENARRISNIFTDWLSNTKNLNPELIKLSTNANNNATALENAEKSANAASEAQKNLGKNVNATTQRIKEQGDALIKSLQIQNMSDRERAKAEAERDKESFARQEGRTKEQIAAYNAARDEQSRQDIARIDKTEQEKNKRIAEAQEKREQSAARKSANEAERQRNQAETFIDGIKRQGADELAVITENERQKLARLDELQKEGALKPGEYESTKTKIMLDADTARQEELAKREEERRKKDQKGDEFMAQILGQNATELELLDIQEKQKQDIAQQYRDQGIINEDEYQSAMAAIAGTYNKKRRTEYANMLGQTTDDLKTALGEGNKVYKAFAIANAIMNTYQSAVAAYQSAAAIPVIGWIAAPIAAGAAVAAGLANVAKIRSAREQGGSLAAGGLAMVGERNKAELIMPAGASRVRTMEQVQQMMGGKQNNTGNGGVTIVNNTTGRIDSATTERDDEGRLRIIIEEQVSASLLDSNSRISKSRRATRGQAGFS